MTTKTTTKDYKTFIKEVLDITSNCEGSGLVSEINEIANEYETYLSNTPLPITVAKWINELFMIIDNCEGSGLQRELASLKSPI